MKRAVLLGVLLLGCGRGSASVPEDESPGSVGASPEPFYDPAATPQVPQPEPSAELPCPNEPPLCITDCESIYGAAAAPVCSEHEWHCPDRYVDRSTCAADSCAFIEVSCCTPQGQRVAPPCTPEGRIGNCPAGSRAYDGGSCVPVGVGACYDLIDDVACESRELECYSDKCGVNCTCEPTPEDGGALKWHCRSLPC